jgi:GNAT superfamily N-acetyltransferase
VHDATGDALTIRRIRGDEGPLLRTLRLRSLAEAPEAFGQTLEEAIGRPDDEWAAQARQAAEGDRRAWFIAELPLDRSDGRGSVELGGEAPGGRVGARSPLDPDVGDRTPVGLVLGRRRPPDTALVFSMWVDPRVRRRGIGALLIDAIDDWAERWGAASTLLWVFAANEPAIRFYQRIGFEVETTGPEADAGVPYGAFAMRRRRSGCR